MSDKPIIPDKPGDARWEWFEAHLTPQLKNRLYYEAFTILHNQQDAEDALAFARLHAVTKLHQLKKEDKFGSWMFTIVRREAHHIKINRSRSLAASFQYKEDGVKPSSSPEQHLIDSERKSQLLRALNQLKSPDKEIVTLRNWHGMSLLDIARKLDLNYHTTRSKYTRAMHALWRMLKKEGGDDSHETR